MRIKPFLLLAAAGTAGLALVIGNDALAKYEEPAYGVDRKEGNFEIRSYPSVIAAEVEVSGLGESSANSAFKILAGYIFGKNVSKTKIAMTVPVTENLNAEKIAMTVPVTTAVDNESMIMRFFMPSKYSLETLPEPLDKRILLHRLPPRKFAVIRFSGFSSNENCRQHEEQLKTWLKNQNLEAAGDALRAFYNPPWTLPFMRRNEIWIPL